MRYPQPEEEPEPDGAALLAALEEDLRPALEEAAKAPDEDAALEVLRRHGVGELAAQDLAANLFPEPEKA